MYLGSDNITECLELDYWSGSGDELTQKNEQIFQQFYYFNNPSKYIWHESYDYNNQGYCN